MELPDDYDNGHMIHLFASEVASILGKNAPTVSNLDELAEILRDEIEVSKVRRLFDTFAANTRALRTYVPATYPGRVVLFKARASAIGADDPSLGWQDLAEGGLDIHVVDGDHFSMLRRPHVEFLAERLKPYLDNRKKRNLAQLLSNY
jgi:thioesterase domain-containing protein